MLLNKNIAIFTNRVVLIPYCAHHVEQYHEWMKDVDIQAATASEPLSRDEEYSMQQCWRMDADKLTFITCKPLDGASEKLTRDIEIRSMLGDINLFVILNEEESGDLSLAGEIELMVALKSDQRQGLGRASLLTFLAYVLKYEKVILEEYFTAPRDVVQRNTFTYLRAKIGETNIRSQKLFESVGFTKTSASPNYFGEFELRTKDLKLETIQRMMEEVSIQGYSEVRYEEDNQAFSVDLSTTTIPMTV